MKYAPLGRSGLVVSRICLGGNSWGARGRRGWGAFDAAESAPFFRKALDLGITFFDTANSYNQGRSEEIIGEVLLRMVPRDEVVISTKVGIAMGDRPNESGLGRKHVMRSIDAQLRRLRTDHVDVYQVHRLDPHTPVEEFMETLDMLVRAGKVRHVGGSTMPAYKFAQMLMFADWRGLARPICMQNLYNLVQREEEREMNRLCHEQGVGLIPYSPLARGFLAGNRDPAGGGATERAANDKVVKPGTYRSCDWVVVERLRAVAAARGATPAQVALAWLLAKPAMVAPIMGATSLGQLEGAAAAVDIALGADEIAALEAPYEFRPAPAD
jgi:aryl-alcohol dehydrogenase (NADP+)